MSDRQPLTQHGFLELPVTRELSDEVDIAILGVPYDLATTGRAGARGGPQGVRQASWHMSWEEQHWPWRFALADRLKVVDFGDVVFDTGNTAQMVEVLRSDAREVVDAGKTLISLGGDHFVTLPLLYEHHAKHGRVSLIHFDAHSDTERCDGIVNHGSMFRNAIDEALIDPARSIQIGIRTEYERAGHPMAVLDAAWVNAHPPEETAAAIRRVVGDNPAYLTFDIDCLDPAYAPGTGTPVPGGLSTDHALRILRELVPCNLVGMDVVEVAPAYDHAEITSLAAAALVLELLYVFVAKTTDLQEMHELDGITAAALKAPSS